MPFLLERLLGEDVENPDMGVVWDLIAEAGNAVQGPFDDVFVRRYDIPFTFDVRKTLRDFRANQKHPISDDSDDLFEAEECQRVALIDALVDRYATDAGFTLGDLRDAVEEVDDIEALRWTTRARAVILRVGAGRRRRRLSAYCLPPKPRPRTR